MELLTAITEIIRDLPIFVAVMTALLMTLILEDAGPQSR